MKLLTIKETKQMIGGGSSVTGAILSSIKGCIVTVFEIGQAVGGAIRRIITGNLCGF